MPLPLPFPGAFSRGAGVQAETLAFPEGVTFPVTLQRTATEYRVRETAASFDDYTGDTIFVATTGNDTTGDGSSGNPYRQITKAHTEASNGDIISLSPGIYATPATLTKNVKLTAPSGGVFIGALEDVSGETFTLAGDGRRWTITAGSTSTKWRGFVRLDNPGVFLDGFVDQHLTLPRTDTSAMSALGIPCMAPSSSTAVSIIYLGGANPNTLAAAGDLLMWRETATDDFEVSGNVWVGSGITIANVGGSATFGSTGAITINDGARLVLDRTKVFGGGAGPTISNPGTGTLIAFGATISGSTDDLIDGRGTSTSVEIDCNVVWGGIQAAGNTSTMHDSAKSLRVGGTYYGSCRTVHDINTTRNFIFSCTLGEVIADDKQVLRIGLTTDLTETDYGDLTFVNTIGVTGVTNLTVDASATATNTELDDPWPY